jgi:hypothetical protein
MFTHAQAEEYADEILHACVAYAGCVPKTVVVDHPLGTA